MAETRTYWRGALLCQRAADMMTEVARLLGDAAATLDPTQGSFNTSVSASGGTHSGCGAIDLAAAALTGTQREQIVYRMREVGWAAWLRTPAQSDWPYHVHGIAVACPGLSPAAADQVVDYYEGRNGLASGAPDDGPRDFVGVTWETYQASTHPPKESFLMALTDQQQTQLFDNIAFLRREANGAFLFRRKSDGAAYLAAGTGARHLNPGALSTLTNLGVPMRYDMMDDGPCTELINALGGERPLGKT